MSVEHPGAVEAPGAGQRDTIGAPLVLQPATPSAGPARGIGRQVSAYAVVLLISFISLFPLYWMVINSFLAQADISQGIVWFPSVWHLDNYSGAWNSLEYPFQVYIINSFILTIVVTVGTAISCLLVAYGFARFRFPGREFLFIFIISTMMIPYAVLVIPQYAEFINIFGWGKGGHIGINIGSIHWTYTDFFQFLPQMVPAFFGSPVFIFLLRQFIRGIPYDLDEAAKIDGAGPMRILWTVILPEVRPALAAVVVLTFIGKWNDLFGPIIFLQDSHNWTIEIALLGFFSRYTGNPNWPWFMAMSLVTMLPIVVIYFLASKQIIQGVTLSGVKG